MISVQEAFKKFGSKLELTETEHQDASRRQQDIRRVMKGTFELEHDFLTGSYRRWTKTKPLKDVDIFCVFGQKERHYRDKTPCVVLAHVERALVGEYGKDSVSRQRRSVSVDFGVEEDDNGETGGRVMSFDVVPAFSKDGHYEIPDTATPSGWIETDPRIHYDKALEAQKAYSGEWKRLVRMMKAWNRAQGKPIKPSFLIEVMALQVLHPPFGGDYRRELQGFFASLAGRIHEEWPDPAGLGPPVSDSMTAQDRGAARLAAVAAERQVAEAIRLEKLGSNGEALRTWRALFGKLFPLS
jgi:hypothetical protein